MNPVQATCPAALIYFAALICFRDSGCTAAETMVAVFLFKGSDLQVRPEVGCGNETQHVTRLQDGVGHRVNEG